MKIQIASDLHLEMWPFALPSTTKQFQADLDRDVLVLAGDIMDGRRQQGLDFLAVELDRSPIIYVPGNHEYYHSSKKEVDKFWTEYDRTHEHFYYLNDRVLEWNNFTIYGAEWCSDFWGNTNHKRYYSPYISDFNLIKGWSTSLHIDEHRRINQRLQQLAGKLDIVITHYPPTLAAIDQELYANNRLNGYFINNKENLVRDVNAQLWIAGHTHSPFDYQVGNTRIIGNPRGYPDEPPRPRFSCTKTVSVENKE